MIRTCLAGFAACVAMAQNYETPRDLEPASRALLARQVLAAPGGDSEREHYDRLLLHLQAGDLNEALATAQRLRDWPRGPLDPMANPVAPLQELHARTRIAEVEGLAPEAALDRAFAEMVSGQPGMKVYRLAWALVGDPAFFQRSLREQWEGLRTQPRVTRSEAVRLLRLAQTEAALARLLPGAARCMAAEEALRYVEEEDLHIPMPDGAFLCATLIRPRIPAKVSTALEFTIYINEFKRSEALRSAAEGYAGLIVYTRGKRHSPGPLAPFEHDGKDAAAVIDWVVRQPWSDGKVGMYGGSYNGFTQWAAAKHRPEGLKSIMPSVAVAPGIDVPMEGGIFQSFFYPWAPYVSKGPGLDEAGYGNRDHWEKVNLAWYLSGSPYRDLDKFDDAPNALWRRWLDHPTYDDFWKRMTASGTDFARIDIPVLSTSGYFDGCLLSTCHYFESHQALNPKARHYLLLGPYNHFGGQFQAWDEVDGYRIDPSARIDIVALRYQWLGHTLHGGPLPALVKDRVNVQVMGADAWRHAPSLEALAPARRTFHLASTQTGGLRLVPRLPADAKPSLLRVDLARRAPSSAGKPEQAYGTTLDDANALVFRGEPLTTSMELSGAFRGELLLTLNKRDVDLTLQLIEQTPEGRYFLLSHLLGRASLMEDREHRNLLKPGRPTRLPFRSQRPVSRRLAVGSRLLFLVGVVKHPRAQVNYGTGREVSDESLKDAGAPLTLRLAPGSRLSLPFSR